jgi:cyclophilin family peptidyl-prolyl cis-trans isomerase
MAASVKRWRRVAHAGLLGGILSYGLAGCGKQPAAGQEGAAPSSPDSVAQDTQTIGSAQGAPGALEPRLHQPFQQAIIQDPPESQMRPPDTTKAGKAVGKLYETVLASWDRIKFQTPEGKPLSYSARIKTDLGTIAIELWPRIAPNHVRSLVALARAGYFDGLDFDRVYREEQPEAKGTFLEYVEAGCPLGLGDPGYGSIGYWLKPELNSRAHEEGTVGAWHAEELESAACKFYITLSKAPWMDGNFTVFGKVVEGLDVVRKISTQPRRSEDPLEDHPLTPVVIREVTIKCQEGDRAKSSP